MTDLSLQILEALGHFTGSGNAIAAIFDRMEVAEQEIDAEATRYERGRGGPIGKRIRKEAFRYLAPNELLRTFGMDVYRAHVRELVRRVGRQEKLEPGTDAEVLCALSTMSTKAPPGQDFSAAMHRVFAKVMPPDVVEHFQKRSGLRHVRAARVHHRGAEALIEDLRAKLACERDVHKRVNP